MARKWFSVFIVCILLFVICGCRSVEGGAMPKRQFVSMRAYAQTMDDAITQKAVESIFDNRKTDPSLMVMLFEDRCFVMPTLEQAVVTSVVLNGEGYSDFLMELPHECVMTVRIYHYAYMYDEEAYSDFEKTAITIGSGRTFEGVRYRKETVQDGETTVQNRYILQRDGYPIEILADNTCECDAYYVTALSFRTEGGPSCIPDSSRYDYLAATTKRTTTASWEEPPLAYDGSPPNITLRDDKAAYTLRHGTSRWTFRWRESGEISTVCSDAFHPTHHYSDRHPTLIVSKGETRFVTVSCEYAPLSLKASCTSMNDKENRKNLTVTMDKDDKGNPTYTFPLEAEGFYAYTVTLEWERFGESNLSHYSFYSKSQENR